MTDYPMNRREFCRLSAAGALAFAAPLPAIAADDDDFRLRYILGSSMYGTTDLSEILPAVHATGAEYIDIWPRRHGNQREQVEEMGHDAFAALLKANDVRLGMITRYDLGPFGLTEEMGVAKKFGAKVLISGSGGPKDLEGDELKAALKSFGEKIKPHAAAAAEHGLVIGIENHGSALVDSPDSIRWFRELVDSPNVGVALAPYHLPQDPAMLAELIETLGPQLAHFYAWQHGMGCMTKLPKEQELLQMPGRGSLDFVPLLTALKKINYAGWTEIFMHPVPRGIPILETTAAVNDEINRARQYLNDALQRA